MRGRGACDPKAGLEESVKPPACAPNRSSSRASARGSLKGLASRCLFGCKSPRPRGVWGPLEGPRQVPPPDPARQDRSPCWEEYKYGWSLTSSNIVQEQRDDQFQMIIFEKPQGASAAVELELLLFRVIKEALVGFFFSLDRFQGVSPPTTALEGFLRFLSALHLHLLLIL